MTRDPHPESRQARIIIKLRNCSRAFATSSSAFSSSSSRSSRQSYNPEVLINRFLCKSIYFIVILDRATVRRHILLSIFHWSCPTQETLKIESTPSAVWVSWMRRAVTSDCNNISSPLHPPPFLHRDDFSRALLFLARPCICPFRSRSLLLSHELSFTFIYFLNVRPHRLLYI